MSKIKTIFLIITNYDNYYSNIITPCCNKTKKVRCCGGIVVVIGYGTLLRLTDDVFRFENIIEA